MSGAPPPPNSAAGGPPPAQYAGQQPQHAPAGAGPSTAPSGGGGGGGGGTTATSQSDLNKILGSLRSDPSVLMPDPLHLPENDAEASISFMSAALALVEVHINLAAQG
ncbi:hypothetical protein PgNI_05809 [Pyricularia grisea]|uniref:Uncharacterized protein n=1 Tax=Pyricularia grisea TaxID=148305 RepID=A0A6P8B7X3_PYRGI|nr:hypothetical protein PgNI_05809 [Pyricularia grisea]TLD11380.1 hypothetical protein PgNI_05809 [Pyricularia grisea]